MHWGEMDLTVEFNLLTFAALRTGSCSSVRVSGGRLRGPKLLARTSRGMVTRRQLAAGDAR